MYWVVFSVFSVVKFFSDTLMGWVPFYWLRKCLFLIWCMSPLDGSTLIYTKFVMPVFNKNKTAIDTFVKNGKEIAGEAFNKASDVIEAELKKSD
jgi:receptor expression-enhancing protein 5/6